MIESTHQSENEPQISPMTQIRMGVDGVSDPLFCADTTSPLSLFLISHHDRQLADFSFLIQVRSMKTQQSIWTDSSRRLLLIVPLICSMAFAACSDLAGRPGTRQAFNFQSAVIGQVHRPAATYYRSENL
jgi:hypothetical protein